MNDLDVQIIWLFSLGNSNAFEAAVILSIGLLNITALQQQAF